MDLVKVTNYQGVIRNLAGRRSYLLDIEFPICEGVPTGDLRVAAWGPLPSSQLAMQSPSDTNYQKVEDGKFRLRVFIYYSQPVPLKEFDWWITLRADGMTQEGEPTSAIQRIPLKLIVI